MQMMISNILVINEFYHNGAVMNLFNERC